MNANPSGSDNQQIPDVILAELVPINPYASSQVLDAILVDSQPKFAEFKWAVRGMSISIYATLLILVAGATLVWTLRQPGIQISLKADKNAQMAIGMTSFMIVLLGLGYLAGTIMLAIVPSALRARRYIVIAIASVLVLVIIGLLAPQPVPAPKANLVNQSSPPAPAPPMWLMVSVATVSLAGTLSYALYFRRICVFVRHSGGHALVIAYVAANAIFLLTSIAATVYLATPVTETAVQYFPGGRMSQTRTIARDPQALTTVTFLLAVVVVGTYLAMMWSVRRALKDRILAEHNGEPIDRIIAAEVVDGYHARPLVIRQPPSI